MLATALIAVFFVLVVGFSLHGIFAKRDKTRYAQNGQSAGDNTRYFDHSASSSDSSDPGCSDGGASDGGGCDGGGGE